MAERRKTKAPTGERPDAEERARAGDDARRLSAEEASGTASALGPTGALLPEEEEALRGARGARVERNAEQDVEATHLPRPAAERE